jgi:hypothetical protein
MKTIGDWMMRMPLIALVAAMVSTPALASDRLGQQQIAAGDLHGAEATLVAERKIYPQRPELMLNLAAVYQQTGRTAAAQDLYRQVLDRPDVSLLTPSGGAQSSHLIAERGMARLTPLTLATR